MRKNNYKNKIIIFLLILLIILLFIHDIRQHSLIEEYKELINSIEKENYEYRKYLNDLIKNNK